MLRIRSIRSLWISFPPNCSSMRPLYNVHTFNIDSISWNNSNQPRVNALFEWVWKKKDYIKASNRKCWWRLLSLLLPLTAPTHIGSQWIKRNTNQTHIHFCFVLHVVERYKSNLKHALCSTKFGVPQRQSHLFNGYIRFGRYSMCSMPRIEL